MTNRLTEKKNKKYLFINTDGSSITEKTVTIPPGQFRMVSLMILIQELSKFLDLI